jgi:hypothetical protein
MHPDIFGQQGHNDDAQRFYETWRAKQASDGLWIIFRRDGEKGCFSFMKMSNGWDIAFYQFETAKEVALSTNRAKFDPVYFQSDAPLVWQAIHRFYGE